MKTIEGSKENEPQVWINFYKNKLKNPQTALQRSYNEDLVRISIEQGTFKKGYLEDWSEELIVVKHAVGNNPTLYKSQDQAGEDIKGMFYSKELEKVTEPESYRIEKVIRKKRDRDRIFFKRTKHHRIKSNYHILWNWILLNGGLPYQKFSFLTVFILFEKDVI